MDPLKIKKVFVVFKTHLDIGFTDLSQTVLEQYLTHHIPASIRLASRMNTETDKKFIWTLGSYPIYLCLHQGSAEAAGELRRAIRRGDIAWHGLACTSHTELQDEELLDFNLSLSRELDQEFGRTTIAAKMTDVPGHTRALVSHLASHGIAYLHIGVNPSSMVPQVPQTFVWKNGEQDVIVQYSFEYGAPCYVEGMDQVLEFAHTGDNKGPQDQEQVLSELERLQRKYPNAEVTASTLDQYAEKLLLIKSRLPVVEEEIGDSWIHGVASDPKKTARFRTLLSLKKKWLSEKKLIPGSDSFRSFMTDLMLIPEHTWGMDSKCHLGDFKNWTKPDFQAARKADHVGADSITDRNLQLLATVSDGTVRLNAKAAAETLPEGSPAPLFSGSYRKFESSHEEQRAYITSAVKALPPALQKEADEAFHRLESYTGTIPVQAVPVRPYETLTLGPWRAAVGLHGELSFLARGQKTWVQNGKLGRLVYTVYDARDCMEDYYSYNRDLGITGSWAECDFSKPGLETVPGLTHREFLFPAVRILRSGNRLFAQLAGRDTASEQYGCPRQAVLEYEFADDIRLRVHWADKDASRIPEALWLDMDLDVENKNRWIMQKLGQPVSPLDVVRGGNRRNHCVEALTYQGADGKIKIENFHSPLVSIGGRWLYGNHLEQPDMDQGFSFCLYNNKWGTNFKLWYEEDATFEYRIQIENFG